MDDTSQCNEEHQLANKSDLLPKDERAQTSLLDESAELRRLIREAMIVRWNGIW